MADVPLNQAAPQVGEEGSDVSNAPVAMGTKIQQMMMETAVY